MLEIHPKFEKGTNFDEVPRSSGFHRRFKSSKFQTQDAFVDDIYRLKKTLLSKSNPYANRTTIARNSFRLTDEQSSTLTSMLPDEIIKNPMESEIRNFEAAVFFADISGFTDLSDKYQNFENGASKLSMVLNFYIGTMVQEILSHGGDIIKYAGDAFLAIFRSEDELSFQDAVQRAIDASLIIQKSCSNYLTEIGGVVLNVKIAISVGEVFFSTIGNELSAHYAIVGDPVWQVKELQNIIKAGEVLVTPKVWFYAQESNYVSHFNKDSKSVKVTGFKDDSEGVHHQHAAVFNFIEMRKQMVENEKESTSVTIPDTLTPSTEALAFGNNLDQSPNYSLRPGVSLDAKSKKFLRRFIITPVLNAIERIEPIEHLTEMRDVVIVFSNFVVEKSSPQSLIKVVDLVYTKLCSVVASHEGVVNKVSLFDKDMMFLIIFGLRGFKHELESRIGLRCASELVETFETWPEIVSVSCGVTSGMCYCGVVGHSLRREYSVISITVNKAARLMMAYPDIVSCDQETMMNSKMELKNFTLLPYKTLKGLRGDVFAYQFNEIIADLVMKTPVDYEFPILGRDEIMNLYNQTLATEQSFFNESRNRDSTSQPTSCLLIKGETQSGKTRVLNEIFTSCLNENIKCIHLSLNLKHSKQPNLVFTTILKKVFDLEDLGSVATQKKLEKVFVNVTADLAFLNELFGTSFSALPADQTEFSISKARALTKLCKQAFQDFWVVLIDDAEFMDVESFGLLKTFFDLNSVLLVFALGQQKKLSEKQKRLLDDNRVTSHHLKPIDLMYQNQLVCQHLDISGLTIEFEKFLHQNSNGNPGWIETCSKSLLQSHKVEIENMSIGEAFERGFIINDQIFRKNRFRVSEERSLLDQCYQSSNFENGNSEKIIKVATSVLSKHHKDLLSVAKADHDWMVYDSLSSYEQLVCKCASVIGVEFKRDMLFYIMSSSTDRMIGKAMVNLFDLGTFACASRLDEDVNQHRKKKKRSSIVVCNCKEVKVFASCRDLPRYSCCELIRFQREAFSKIVYNSLTDKQRLEYHKRSLVYLHIETRRCDSCGNGNFPELTIDDFDFEFRDGIIDKEDVSFETMVDYFESLNLPVVKRSSKANTNFQTRESFVGKMFSFLWKEKDLKIRPLILNYMNYDFRSCTCNQILYSMYSDSIRHCHGFGNTLKYVANEIHLASLCIRMSNVPRATNLLGTALTKLESAQFDEGTLFPTYLRARAYLLQGLCFADKMQPDQALELYHKTFKTLCVRFPKRFGLDVNLKIRSLIKNIKTLLKRTQTPVVSKLNFMLTTLLSKCFHHMFRILFDRKQYKLAKLAALWGLEKALQIDASFMDLARSFASVFKIGFYHREVGELLWLQKASLTKMAKVLFVQDLSLDALAALIKMYKGIMMWQMKRSKIRLAIQIGEVTKHLCSRVQSTELQTKIVPELFLLLMNMKRIQEAHVILQRFHSAMHFMKDKNGLIWYYALSMDMLLDTSYTVETYETCEQYFFKEVTSFHQDGDKDAKSRFFANLLLFSTRHGVYEMTQIWFQNLEQCYQLDHFGSLNSVFTGLRVMETFTLQISLAIEHRNMVQFMHYDRETEKLIKIIKSAIKLSNCFVERFELHQLHFSLVKNFDRKKLKSLEQLEESAVKQLDFLALDQIKHARRTWSNDSSPGQCSFWLDHSTSESSIDLHRVDFAHRVFPFSLPIPKPESF